MDYKVKQILFLILAIIAAVIIVNFILWLIPIILIGLIAYAIYRQLMFKRKNKDQEVIIIKKR